jgi:pimeloyl-ACP methyl ester carboxylesterase
VTENARRPDGMVLVHGAWQGSWGWSKLLPFLAQRGWQADALDLPGNGVDATAAADVSLERYVEHVANAAARHAEPVVLVGHSGGGVVISQVAEAIPDRVACLVYLAGMMLPSGVGFADIIKRLVPADPEAAGIARHLIWSGDRLSSTVPPDAAIEIFYQDCDPAEARWAASRLTPQPERGRAVCPSLTAERYGRVPRIYVEATRDCAVVPAAQALMQELSPGARRMVMETGHAPQLAQPETLAARLDDTIRDVLSSR